MSTANSQTTVPHYICTDLGTLGGPHCYGQDINEHGDIVGYSKTADGNTIAFLWKSGKMTPLGALPSYPSSFALRINASGQIVGHVTTGGSHGLTRAFRWQKGKMTDLGTLPGDQYSTADSINTQGQIVGSSVYAPGLEASNSFANLRMRLYLWKEEHMEALPIAKDRPTAYDLNDKGTVLGMSGMGGGTAFLYRDGKIIDIGTLGGKYSFGGRLNIHEQVVGEAETKSGDNHAFLYANAKMTDLGTLGGKNSHAHDINTAGVIIGHSELTGNDAETRHAFLYVGGRMLDMNDLLAQKMDWVLTSANAMNDRGEIVCQGEMNKEIHTFLLVPQ